MSILSAQDLQFRLADSGVISYQEQASNPLPGVDIARVVKGAIALKPSIEIIADSPALKTVDANALKTHLEGWMNRHVETVLEPLIKLPEDLTPPEPKEGEEAKPALEMTAPVREICAKLFDAMGTLARDQLQYLIAQLDADDRRVLRHKNVRLGPILVFQPNLNKPAAVRLRAMLWSLAHDKPLPAAVPNDGIVSQRIEGDVDQNFYRAISYPVYGARAIRIDMLDRVINAVYEAAEGGTFKAQHQMAEWLGCPIADLYAVLEAMGHTKTYDPADEVKAEPETKSEAVEAEKAAEASVAEPEKPQPQQAKPELATFRLKKGRANSNGGAGKTFNKDKPKFDNKKFNKKKGKRNKSTNRQPKVMSASAKKSDPEDNPFAVLQQLKK